MPIGPKKRRDLYLERMFETRSQAWENAGLAVDSIVFQESYEERDQVLTQRPTRGQMIYAGEKVTLGISRESYVRWLEGELGVRVGLESWGPTAADKRLR